MKYNENRKDMLCTLLKRIFSLVVIFILCTIICGLESALEIAGACAGFVVFVVVGIYPVMFALSYHKLGFKATWYELNPTAYIVKIMVGILFDTTLNKFKEMDER